MSVSGAPNLEQHCRDLAEQVKRAEQLAADRLQLVQEADAATIQMHDERNAAYSVNAHLRRELLQAHTTIATMAGAHFAGVTAATLVRLVEQTRNAGRQVTV